MNRALRGIVIFLAALAGLAATARANPASRPDAAPVTIKGSMVCNGACIPHPRPEDHVMVVFAIDGPADIRAEVDKIIAEFYPAPPRPGPAKGLDAESAERLMDQFTARLKYYISPDSPALPAGKGKGPDHYCGPAAASAVTGVVEVKDGKRWITASRIEPTKLKYPAPMTAPDRPFAISDKEPVILKISDTLTLKCVPIPPGKFLMGTPVYMWPYFQEEYPHVVTLTKLFYIAEVPVTQEVYTAVMDGNPSGRTDMRTYRPKYTVDGVVHTSQRWWIDLHDHRGIRRRLAGLADRRATEAIGRNIERLVRYVASGEPPDPALARWLADLPPKLQRALADIGLLDPA